MGTVITFGGFAVKWDSLMLLAECEAVRWAVIRFEKLGWSAQDFKLLPQD